jgi:hypothetical protein
MKPEGAVLARGGRAPRSGPSAPWCARLADLPVTATGQNPAELARIAAAALDIATGPHRAHDYEAAIRAAHLAVDALTATARARHGD